MVNGGRAVDGEEGGKEMWGKEKRKKGFVCARRGSCHMIPSATTHQINPSLFFVSTSQTFYLENFKAVSFYYFQLHFLSWDLGALSVQWPHDRPFFIDQPKSHPLFFAILLARLKAFLLRGI